MRMHYIREMPSPEEVKAAIPATAAMQQQKAARDAALQRIIRGEDDRFIMVIGPCSADRGDAVLEYTARLAEVQQKVKDKIFIIPRVYTTKPRTTGGGYKGMLHLPDPSGRSDMVRGVMAIRELHVKVLQQTGLSAADEMLYPENYAYLSDLLSYVAVGARSSENQQHRLVASGIDVPVGIKNPTSGDLSVMMNSITAAQHHHTFPYRGWEVHSEGNPLAHAIIRGYVDDRGQSTPNYRYEDLVRLSELYAARELQNPAVIVDASHDNSNKQCFEQVRIAKEVLHSRRHSSELARLVKGIMVESYLVDGKQAIGENIYGKSITDPCLGWEKTERLLLDMADLL